MKINHKAMDFSADALVGNEIKKINLSDYKGKWVVLFFYPAEFTNVCSSELVQLSKIYNEINRLGCELLSISVDTAHAHRAWRTHAAEMHDIAFPMVADPSRRICLSYGTLIEDEGMSLRATFIIDPDGIVKSVEMNENRIGRSSEELLRKLQAAQHVRSLKGSSCPMDWKPVKSEEYS